MCLHNHLHRDPQSLHNSSTPSLVGHSSEHNGVVFKGVKLVRPRRWMAAHCIISGQNFLEKKAQRLLKRCLQVTDTCPPVRKTDRLAMIGHAFFLVSYGSTLYSLIKTGCGPGTRNPYLSETGPSFLSSNLSRASVLPLSHCHQQSGNVIRAVLPLNSRPKFTPPITLAMQDRQSSERELDIVEVTVCMGCLRGGRKKQKISCPIIQVLIGKGETGEE